MVWRTDNDLAARLQHLVRIAAESPSHRQRSEVIEAGGSRLPDRGECAAVALLPDPEQGAVRVLSHDPRLAARRIARQISEISGGDKLEHNRVVALDGAPHRPGPSSGLQSSDIAAVLADQKALW